MAVIFERKGKDGTIHYQAKVRLKGYHTESTTFENRRNAVLWAKQTEDKMRGGRMLREQQLSVIEHRYRDTDGPVRADIQTLVSEVRQLRKLKDFR